MQKIQRMKISKQYQLESYFIYSLTALSCGLLCSSPFWFPSLCSSVKIFLFVSLPKVGLEIISPKLLFIVGNLIVFILIGESKLFASDASSASKVYYEEYISKCKITGAPKNFPTLQVGNIKDKKQESYSSEENVVLEKNEKAELDGKVYHHFAFPAEELNKRADDFIARVNRRRRLEARLLGCSGKLYREDI